MTRRAESITPIAAPLGERIEAADATLDWYPAFLGADTAARLFAELRDAIAWEQHRLRLFGREVASPRLSCWIGDADAIYTYSRVRFEPRAWPRALLRVRDEIARATGAHYNSVLANRYRDGNDAMGWHADNEPELGDSPIIASLSLGATRRFVMKRRDGSARRELALTNGSLLVMRGDTQRHWLHAVPRERAATAPRINLTFRQIHARA
jgi:alkylated DNA repair dioxygenase AlkB